MDLKSNRLWNKLACLVALILAICTRSASKTSWRCLIWNRRVNMEINMIYTGGTIQCALLVVSQHMNVTFVYATRPKVLDKQILRLIKCNIIWNIVCFAQVLSVMWQFVKKIRCMVFGQSFLLRIQTTTATISYGARLNQP